MQEAFIRKIENTRCDQVNKRERDEKKSKILNGRILIKFPSGMESTTYSTNSLHLTSSLPLVSIHF